MKVLRYYYRALPMVVVIAVCDALFEAISVNQTTYSRVTSKKTGTIGSTNG